MPVADNNLPSYRPDAELICSKKKIAVRCHRAVLKPLWTTSHRKEAANGNVAVSELERMDNGNGRDDDE